MPVRACEGYCPQATKCGSSPPPPLATVMVSGFNRNATIRNSDFAYIGGNAIAAWGYTNETSGDNHPQAGVDGTDGEHPRYTTVLGNTAREVGLYEKQVQFGSTANPFIPPCEETAHMRVRAHTHTHTRCTPFMDTTLRSPRSSCRPKLLSRLSAATFSSTGPGTSLPDRLGPSPAALLVRADPPVPPAVWLKLGLRRLPCQPSLQRGHQRKRRLWWWRRNLP